MLILYRKRRKKILSADHQQHETRVIIKENPEEEEN